MSRMTPKHKRRFKMKISILPVIALLGAVLAVAPAQAMFAVQLVGTSQANDFSNLTLTQQQVIEDFFADEDLAGGRVLEDFLCYVLPLEDLQSGVTVGTGADCLRIFDVAEDATAGASSPAISPMIDAVTFFFLPGGHFTADGMTTVRPFFTGVGDAAGEVTHMTGSIPAGGSSGGIVDGSGRFATASGNVRLSGAVNLGDFFTDGNPIYFSCLFVAEFDSKGGRTARSMVRAGR
jgi:hypothetical protein